MTSRIDHITADHGPRLAWSEAGFVHPTDSFFPNLGTARGPIVVVSVNMACVVMDFIVMACIVVACMIMACAARARASLRARARARERK